MDLIHFLIDFILHIDVHLAELVAQYGVWVYAILFLILFCETGLVVTPFLPGDSLLFVAGALSALPTNDLTFFKWLFPSAAFLKRFYYYCYKHPILVPVAWFHRFFKAVFGHFSVSKQTAREMFTKQEMPQSYFDVSEELQIDDNHHYD